MNRYYDGEYLAGDGYGLTKLIKEFVYHAFNDKPSVIILGKHNKKFWHRNGELHRENGNPAVMFWDGDCLFFKDGVQC